VFSYLNGCLKLFIGFLCPLPFSGKMLKIVVGAGFASLK
jgi:hypothetical protein